MSPLEGIGAVLGIIIVLAYILESLVEAVFGMWIDYVPKFMPLKKPILKTIAWIFGVGIAFGFQLDMMGYISSVISSTIGEEYIINAPAWLLYLITGLSIGQGSSFIHQLMSKTAPLPEKRLGEL